MNQKHLVSCIAGLLLVPFFIFSCLFGQERTRKAVGDKPTMSYLENKNIVGGDYKSFELKPGETCQACIDACLNDPNCKAYTYVKPGALRQNAMCWLKSAVSNPVDDPNCISGVKAISGGEDVVIDQSGSRFIKEAVPEEEVSTGTVARAVYGASTVGDGVRGQSRAENKSGVYGFNSNKLGYGVFGRNGTSNTGYLGGPEAGVLGEGWSAQANGVWGVSRVNDGCGVRGESAADKGTGVFAIADGKNGIGLRAEGGLNGKAAVFKGNVQIKSFTTNETVIELGEGLDYAEGFDVSTGNEVSPGTVLVIDTENPGKLTVSRKPFDHKVAGVVAGANGLNSGVRLGADQFGFAVALAGRVHCNVDASYGEVSPGDLLTTSPTPGHAMAVKDYARAQGAILGKAMQSLPKGQRGQILILVTLQ
jgi:hypothetical protein